MCHHPQPRSELACLPVPFHDVMAARGTTENQSLEAGSVLTECEEKRSFTQGLWGHQETVPQGSWRIPKADGVTRTECFPLWPVTW